MAKFELEQHMLLSFIDSGICTIVLQDPTVTLQSDFASCALTQGPKREWIL
jgi:hypothetical protein